MVFLHSRRLHVEDNTLNVRRLNLDYVKEVGLASLQLPRSKRLLSDERPSTLSSVVDGDRAR
jgi:hypothetical protein